MVTYYYKDFVLYYFKIFFYLFESLQVSTAEVISQHFIFILKSIVFSKYHACVLR